MVPFTSLVTYIITQRYTKQILRASMFKLNYLMNFHIHYTCMYLRSSLLSHACVHNLQILLSHCTYNASEKECQSLQLELWGLCLVTFPVIAFYLNAPRTTQYILWKHCNLRCSLIVSWMIMPNHIWNHFNLCHSPIMAWILIPNILSTPCHVQS